MDTETLVRAAQILVGHGLTISAPGWFDVSPGDELRTYLTDRDQWRADRHGVTKEQMAEYERYEGTPHCAAVTKRGTLCKNKPADAPYGYGPEWFFEWHCEGYCRIHG